MIGAIVEAVAAAKEVAAGIESCRISLDVMADMKEMLKSLTGEVSDVSATAAEGEASIASSEAETAANASLEANAEYVKSGHFYETDECGLINKTDGKEINELAKEYLDDLKNKSDCPETIKAEIDKENLEVVSPDRVRALREDFDNQKNALRNEWSQVNNREWPRYQENVYNKAGKMIRKAGDCYDAHHIRPLQLGGKNEVSNITPLQVNAHVEIHSTGTFKELVNAVMGGL